MMELAVEQVRPPAIVLEPPRTPPTPASATAVCSPRISALEPFQYHAANESWVRSPGNVYVAEVRHPIDEVALRATLKAGVETVEDGVPLVVRAQLLRVDGQSLSLVVDDGKYRTVRRALACAGHPVEALHRVSSII
jgi:hypothetical protein